MSRVRKQYSKEFKLAALARMEAGTNVTELARELGVRRKDLYAWREKNRTGEWRAPGRPRKAVSGQEEVIAKQQKRIEELERKLGRKQLEVDFLERTFEHVREAMQKHADSGGGQSTTESEQRFRSKESH
jgi:transposase-like protein